MRKMICVRYLTLVAEILRKILPEHEFNEFKRIKQQLIANEKLDDETTAKYQQIMLKLYKLKEAHERKKTEEQELFMNRIATDPTFAFSIYQQHILMKDDVPQAYNTTKAISCLELEFGERVPVEDLLQRSTHTRWRQDMQKTIRDPSAALQHFLAFSNQQAPPPGIAKQLNDMIRLAAHEVKIDLSCTSSKGKGTDKAKSEGFLRTLKSVSTIVREKLYRAVNFSNMDSYFTNCHNISRAQVYRLLDCFKVIQELSNFTHLPLKQRICRTLKRLGPDVESRRKLWAAILDEYGPDAITTLSSNEIITCWNNLVTSGKAVGTTKRLESDLESEGDAMQHDSEFYEDMYAYPKKPSKLGRKQFYPQLPPGVVAQDPSNMLDKASGGMSTDKRRFLIDLTEDPRKQLLANLLATSPSLQPIGSESTRLKNDWMPNVSNPYYQPIEENSWANTEPNFLQYGYPPQEYSPEVLELMQQNQPFYPNNLYF